MKVAIVAEALLIIVLAWVLCIMVIIPPAAVGMP